MEFEWDEAKSESNVRKHGVDFDLASTVFEDPQAIGLQHRLVRGERRHEIVGASESDLLLFVVYTWRHYERETVCRIISARKAGKKERQRYTSLS